MAYLCGLLQIIKIPFYGVCKISRLHYCDSCPDGASLYSWATCTTLSVNVRFVLLQLDKPRVRRNHRQKSILYTPYLVVYASHLECLHIRHSLPQTPTLPLKRPSPPSSSSSHAQTAPPYASARPTRRSPLDAPPSSNSDSTGPHRSRCTAVWRRRCI